MKKLICSLIMIFSFMLLAASSEAASDKQVTIKFGSVNNTNHPVVRALNDVFKPRVEKLSGGKITVKIFDNASLGEEGQMLEQTQIGVVQMASVSEVISTIFPKINIMNLPYLFENNKQVDAVIDGAIGKKILEGLDQQKLIGLGFFENGFRVTSNSKRPINKLADIKGLKIRTPQSPAQINIFNAFGANVTPLSFAELFSALQQKVVDGQENGYNTIVTQSFYEVQPYIAETNHMWGSFVIIANLKWWNDLPEEYRTIIQKAVTEASKYERKLAREAVTENKKVCIDKKVAITTPNLREFVKAVEPVYNDFYAKYPQFKSLVQEVIALKK